MIQQTDTATFDKVTQAVLKKYKVTPQEHENILKKIDSFMHELRLALQKDGVDAYVMLGGSAAKGTFLKHDFDCDVFVRFIHDKYKYSDISSIMEQALKKVPRICYERVHGSRDYFQGIWKGIHYEIIPVLYITNKNMAMNITDNSPLHVEWLNLHLSEKLRDEILLTKLFFKAQKVYGAESYMHGFSGHIVDILIVYYSSFLELLKNIISWQEKKVINMTSHPVNLNTFNQDKLQSAIIVIDPIQPDRNAAAAVGYEQFYHIKNQAGLFLQKPDITFFQRKSISKKELKKNKRDVEKQKGVFIVLQAFPLHGKLDTIGTKMFRAYEYIKQELIHHDFTIIKTGWDWIEKQEKPAFMWFAIKEKLLPEIKEHTGPPLKMQKDVAAFRAKHTKTYFKAERICAYIKRDYTTPLALIQSLLKMPFIKEKAKKWGIVRL